VQGLNDVKCSQNVKISQLLEDNKTLTGICKEQDCNLKCSDHDSVLLGKELDKNNNDIQNLNCQIRQRICEQNDLQAQLNKCNAMNIQFQNNIKDYELQNNGLKCENDNLKNNLVQEKSVRIEENQKNNQLNNILNDRDEKINMLNHDIESIKLMQINASKRNCVLQDENDKLRKHIMVLTNLNQTLNNEIDNIINEDEKMQCILDRKERINSVLVNNRCNIDKSLNSLDYINRTNICHCQIHCCHECP
jgi:chromosome segregation ATPase